MVTVLKVVDLKERVVVVILKVRVAIVTVMVVMLSDSGGGSE